MIDVSSVRRYLFGAALLGREDISLLWLLGEQGDILIHDQFHAYLDKLGYACCGLTVGESGSASKYWYSTVKLGSPVRYLRFLPGFLATVAGFRR